MEGSTTDATVADPRHVLYAHVMYGLHATSILIGVVTAASVGWYVFFWPSIVAVVMNYLRRNQVRGTTLEAHFRWQLWTFWTTAAPILCVSLLVFTIVLIPLVIAVYVAAGIWAAYRIGRGWLTLRNGRALPA